MPNGLTGQYINIESVKLTNILLLILLIFKVELYIHIHILAEGSADFIDE